MVGVFRCGTVKSSVFMECLLTDLGLIIILSSKF